MTERLAGRCLLEKGHDGPHRYGSRASWNASERDCEASADECPCGHPRSEHGLAIHDWNCSCVAVWEPQRRVMAGRNPEDHDPLERCIEMYCTADIAESVRAQPIEAFAFAIGGSMGAISNARRLFEAQPWTAAELMRMERDLIEARNWIDKTIEHVGNRKPGV